MSMNNNVLAINETDEINLITSKIKQALRSKLHKRGLIIAISGGVDSAVCAALAVEALGKNKVYGLLLPETDSSSASVKLGKKLAEQLGIEYTIQDISPSLEAIGCYQWRDDAIKNVFPQYKSNWKNKLVISGGQEGKTNHFSLVVQTPEGEVQQERLRLKEYLQIVAATNFKQRIRKNVEYFHADRLNYAVIGTANRLEYDQGFFVKNGDGASDIKIIAHLYKTQVYALANYLKLPEEICTAKPTTDTFSMPQGQDEFYFALPYDKMDIALWCLNNNIKAEELSKMIGIDSEHAEFIYKDIQNKRKTTHYQHAIPVLIKPVDEITS